MGVTGTGIASNSTIVSIFNGYKDENKSTPLNHVYTMPLTAEGDTTVPGTVIINNSSTFVADRTITLPNNTGTVALDGDALAYSIVFGG